MAKKYYAVVYENKNYKILNSLSEFKKQTRGKPVTAKGFNSIERAEEFINEILKLEEKKENKYMCENNETNREYENLFGNIMEESAIGQSLTDYDEDEFILDDCFLEEKDNEKVMQADLYDNKRNEEEDEIYFAYVEPVNRIGGIVYDKKTLENLTKGIPGIKKGIFSSYTEAEEFISKEKNKINAACSLSLEKERILWKLKINLLKNEILLKNNSGFREKNFFVSVFNDRFEMHYGEEHYLDHRLLWMGSSCQNFASLSEAREYCEKMKKRKNINENLPYLFDYETDPEVFKRSGYETVFVDGSYVHDAGIFASAAVFYNGEAKEPEIYTKSGCAGSLEYGSTIAELEGAQNGITEALKKGADKIAVFYDAAAIVDVLFTESYNKPGIAEYNKKFRNFFEKAKNKAQIVFVKVKAHAGNKFNNMADRAAKDEITKYCSIFGIDYVVMS